MKNQSLNTSAWRQLVFIATSALFVCFTGHTSSTSTHSLDRELASRALPVLRETRDQGEILNNYPQYLWFVLEIGKDVDPKTASQLNTLYQSMRKKNREAAANFLKGLRFEIVQKADFMGASPAQLTTNHPEIRRWVKRFLVIWLHEADEQLFRQSAQLVRK